MSCSSSGSTPTSCLVRSFFYEINFVSIELFGIDFTNQFIKALKTLEGIKKTDHLSVRQNAFYKFYKEFGTHYFIESKFGGKLVIETEYSKSEVKSALGIDGISS